MGRKKTVSDDVAAIIAGASPSMPKDKVAEFAKVNVRTVYRIFQRVRETGTSARPTVDARRLGRDRLLNGGDIAFMRGIIAQRPDLYLEDLQRVLFERRGVEVSITGIQRALKRCGYTQKKITPAAAERNEVMRCAFSRAIGRYDPAQLVFIDESACDRRTTFRQYAWAMKGQRVIRHSFFVRGKRYSILPALTLEGMIHCKVHEGSFDTELFTGFVRDLLDHMNPYPAVNSVIVMDNCRIHKDPAIVAMIEERGMRVIFLPPYSPDFNPIELAFSAIKARIRSDGDVIREAMLQRDDTDVYRLLYELVFSVSADDAFGWFQKCGYV